MLKLKKKQLKKDDKQASISSFFKKAATKPQPSKLFTTIDRKSASRSGTAAGTAHDGPNEANELDDSDLIPDTPDGKNAAGPCLDECLVTSGQTETKENSVMETPQNIAQDCRLDSGLVDLTNNLAPVTPEKCCSSPEVIADTPEPDLGSLMAKEKRKPKSSRSFLSSARSLSNIGLKKKTAIVAKPSRPTRSLEEALKDPSISGYKSSDVTFEAALSSAVGLSTNQVLCAGKHDPFAPAVKRDPFLMPSPVLERKPEKRKRSEVVSPGSSDVKRSRMMPNLSRVSNVQDRLSLAKGKADPLDTVPVEEDAKLAELLDELKSVPKMAVKKHSRSKTKSELAPVCGKNIVNNIEQNSNDSPPEGDADCNNELSDILSELRHGPLKVTPTKQDKERTSKRTVRISAGTHSDAPDESVKSSETVSRPNEADISMDSDDLDISGILDTTLSELCTHGEGESGGWTTESIPAHFFLRYTVTQVTMKQQSTTLELQPHSTQLSEATAILTGFWLDTNVTVGDIVHVITDTSADKCEKLTVYEINDKQNLLVVNPDLLVSGTVVVNTLYCMRKSVLNEKFKSYDGTNKYMLYGSIIHAIFQKVLETQSFTVAAIRRIGSQILLDSRFLHDMYSADITEAEVKEEVEKYVPSLLKWTAQYLALGERHAMGAHAQKRSKEELSITKVEDIEENLWSPRFGLKGKIDLTVEVKIHKTKTTKLMPLELKTGRASHSADHQGQVTLYTMMGADRRADCGEGLLLYLRTAEMTKIPATHTNKRGLIQLRNEFAYYMRQTLTPEVLGTLPEPINNPRTCQMCPHVIACTAYQRLDNTVHPPTHVMTDLIPTTLAHLNDKHLEYFTKWSRLLHLESSCDMGGGHKSANSDIWCETAWKREQSGMCLSGMLLTPHEGKRTILHNGTILHEYRRCHKHPSATPLDAVGLSQGTSIVVSAEDRPLIAFAQGFILTIDDASVEVCLDRDISTYTGATEMRCRLDKNDGYNSMGSSFTNLARLMENNAISSRLRDLVVAKSKPEFEKTLPKKKIAQVKSILRSLNLPQRKAILRVLMSKDYVLIKGYPGTGKTYTIVCLVRVLTALGFSVLLASYTHSAVDNILLKLKEHTKNFTRLGRLQRIHSEIREFAAEKQNFENTEQLHQYYNSKSIVATTCLGVAGSAVFSKRTFDVCIIDEASQVQQLTTLAPLFVSKRFVLVGDNKQLPPIVKSVQARSEGMDVSLFTHLDDAGATNELNKQYRMNKTIQSISNHLIYNGALECGNDDIATATLHLPQWDDVENTLPVWMQRVLDPRVGGEVRFLDTDGADDLVLSESKMAASCDNQVAMVTNKLEAELVRKITDSAIKCGLSGADLGIITPYRHQVDLVRQNLAAQGHGNVEVNTVDQYQGRDKKMIVMSFVKCQRNQQHESGILKDIRRLNVAVTRARHKLILIGSKTTLKIYEPLETVISHLQTEQFVKIS